MTSHAFPFTNPASALDVTNIQTAAYARLGAPVGASISADIAAIKAEIDNGTYGLSAIETLVDEVESLLKNATYGLSALDTDLGTLLTRLSATRAGYLDNLSAGAVALASVCTETRLVELDAANLPADVDAILTDTADIQPRVPRIVCHMDFWSDNDDEIALTTTAGADHNLPNCVVAGLPSGITIIRVVALLKIALIKDTSGADNAINGATALKVDAASDYSSTVTAINIPDNSWAVDVSEATERGGDAMIGDNDVKAEVTGNGTYYARLEDIVCDGNNLLLKDVGWGIRVYFTV